MTRNLGPMLRALREAREVSQEELGRRLGMTRQRISNIEQPTHNPTAQTIGRMLAALGASWIELGILLDGRGELVAIDTENEVMAAQLRYSSRVELTDETTSKPLASAHGLPLLIEKVEREGIVLALRLHSTPGGTD